MFVQAETISITTAHGTPVENKNASLCIYPDGPILLHDVPLIEELAHFSRERIPERVVHAKGAGAFGYFEVTDDITQYTSAKLFSSIGKRTPIAVRFSTVGGESGSADTVRDPRGFAVKFHTEDGIWDLVGNNTPIFFIRDPVLFPSFVHSQKRNPTTHLKDHNTFWDFISLRPETTHQILFLFSDRGIPDGYRHMNGFGSHTFKLVNSNEDIVFCKFHYKTNQGIKNISPKVANEIASTDPDYSIRDLYNAIANGDFPTYNMSIQIMTCEQAEYTDFNPFDVTKVWPQKDFPLKPVGKITLDRNPINYFAEVEQLAFSPAHMVPGIEASLDRMLLGRIFAYGDAHRYRLGTNYLQIPVNCPMRITNYQRDGQQTLNNQGGAPNYHPNSYDNLKVDPGLKSLCTVASIAGCIKRHDIGNEDNFTQPRNFYQNVLDQEAKDNLANNIANHLKNATRNIQEHALQNFNQVDPALAEKISESIHALSTIPNYTN